MSTYVKTVHVPAPVDGMNTRDDPFSLKVTEATSITNMLTTQAGRLITRGPLIGALNTTAGTPPMGGLIFEDTILLSAASSGVGLGKFGSAAAGVSGNLLRYRFDPTSNSNWSLLNTIAGATISTAPQTARGCRILGFAYGLSAGTGATTSVIYNTTVNERRILRWDGTAVLPTALANGPRYCLDIAGYAQRVFVLGGNGPGGAGSIDLSALYFSNPGGCPADLANEWTDSVSGLTNKIVVGNSDGNDYGVGLGPCDNGLLIFKRRSIHVLRGTGSTTFIIKQLFADTGCISQSSITPYRDGCLFLSDRGWMFTDGVQIQPMSFGVLRDFDDWRSLEAIGWAIPVGGDHMMVGPDGGGQTYIVHMPTNRWTRVVSSVLPGNLLSLPLVGATPQTSFVSAPSTGDLIQAPNAGLTVGSGQMFDTRVNLTFVAFNHNLTFRPIVLAEPESASQLHRVRLLHTYKDASLTSISLSLFDYIRFTSLANPIFAGAAGSGPFQQDMVETKQEVGVLQASISVTGSTTAAGPCSLSRLQVEYVPSRPTPSGW